MATLTNQYVELARFRRVHVTFSVTQFALGVALFIADEPGEWVLIIGPIVISPIQEKTDAD